MILKYLYLQKLKMILRTQNSGMICIMIGTLKFLGSLILNLKLKIQNSKSNMADRNCKK